MHTPDSSTTTAAGGAGELPEGSSRALLDLVPCGAVVLAPDGTVAYLNAPAAALWGIPASAAVGRLPAQVQPAVLPAELLAALSRPDSTPADYWLPHTQQWISLRIEPTPKGQRWVFWDNVTDRHQAEVARQRSSELLLAVEEVAHTGSYDADLATGSFYFSDGMYRLFGEAPQSFVPTLDFIDARSHPADAATVRQVLDEAVLTRQPYTYRRRIRRADGQQRTLEAHGEVRCDVTGTPVQLRGLVQDITERVQAEQELRASHELLQRTIDSSLDLVQVFEAVRDEQGSVIDFRWVLNNNEAKQLYGDVIGQRLCQRNPGVIEAGIFDTFKQVLETGVPDQSERHYRHEQFDGWFYQSTVKLGDGVATTTHDMTSRKQAQEEILRLKEEIVQHVQDRYYSLFHTMDEGVSILEIIYDEAEKPVDLRWVEVNPAFERITGLRGVAGQLTSTVVPTEQHWLDAYDSVIKTGQPLRYENYHAGINQWYRTHTSRIGGPESRLVANIFEDITERKQHEARLRHAAETETFRLRLSDALRPLSSPVDIQAAAAEALGQHLSVDRAYYVDLNYDTQEFIVARNWHRPGAPSHTRRYPLSDWPMPWLLDGHAWVCHDVDTDPTLPESQRANYRSNDIRAAVVVPLIKQGRLAATLVVNQNAPRAWTPSEVALVEETAERTWAAVERAHVEEALRTSEATLAAVFAALPVGVGLLDDQGRLTLANHHMQRYLPTGVMPSRDVTQYPRWYAERPDGSPLPPTEFPGARALRGEEVVPGIEMRYTPDNGPDVWTKVLAVPFMDSQGQLAGRVTVVLDIDEQKRTEQALRHSEEQFRRFVTTSADTFYRMSPDWQQMQPLDGKNFFAPHNDARTPWVQRYLPAEDQAATWASLQAAIAAKQPVALEHRVLRADGTVAWVSSRAMPVLDARGDIVEWFGATTDITARKRAEANLAFLADVSQDLAQLTSLDDTINQLGAKIGAHFGLSRCLFVEIDDVHEVCWVAYGWSREGALDIPGQHRIDDFISPEFQRASRAGETVVIDDVFADARTEGEQYAAFQIGAMVTVPLRRGGEWYFLLGFYDTKPRHWQADELALMRELTHRIWTRLERARAEEALRQSEEEFRTVANLVPDLLWRSNAQGNTTWYNQRWYEYTGQTPAEAGAYGWADVIHPDDQAQSAQHYREAMRTGQPLQQEHRIRSAAGEYRWFLVQALPIRDEQGRVAECFGAATDIHPRKLAEAAMVADKAWLEREVAARTHELQASHDLLQSVFDTNLIAMSVLEAVRDEDGTILDFRLVLASQQLERETGRTDLEGKFYAQEYPGIRLVGIFDLIVHTVETGEPQGMEYYYPHEGFGKWYACQFVKLGDGVVATNLDITERKTAEQERLKNLRLLEQAEAVAGLGSWDYDLDTATMRWSDGMYHLFGLPVGSPTAPSHYLNAVLDEDRPRAEQLVQRLTAGQGFEETLRLRVAEQVKTLRMKAVVLPSEDSQPARVLGVDLDITELQQLEADNLRLRLTQQHALFEAVQAAQEEERKRMAESLHNGIGQILYATKLRLDRLPPLSTDPSLTAARQEAEQLLGEAICQTRALSHELVPMTLEEFGLPTALQDIGQKMSSPQLQLRSHIELDEEAAPLPPALQLALYRMAQELAQNIVKHARGATEATLELETMPGWVLLRAEDNGPGFVRSPAQSSGLGLRSIRDRVALLGGQLETGSIPTGGAYVRIRIPLPLVPTTDTPPAHGGESGGYG
ncbi:PAS domain S-box protein [Hymenobacter sediminis]|uniref:PAS domain-containing protein n=1 Tax=Hymenobacter sediminis TaxID=2218621 RepID=UPI000DA64E28|nr:PAS domain-containing protein [Hymenobacter sediminis]RPD48677.1 PAS domain S-box protein [Hymenobacter sediminis]